jgi:hypothetical protein
MPVSGRVPKLFAIEISCNRHHKVKIRTSDFPKMADWFKDGFSHSTVLSYDSPLPFPEQVYEINSKSQ